LSRKIVTCRLTTMTRSGSRGNGDTTTKKVMCRVGGGEIPSCCSCIRNVAHPLTDTRVAGFTAVYAV
jgi:hypothetical protein